MPGDQAAVVAKLMALMMPMATTTLAIAVAVLVMLVIAANPASD
jgi:hypothetical protein